MSRAAREIPRVRRVVVGHNEQGSPVIQLDGPAPPADGVAHIWSTASVPNAGDTGGNTTKLTLGNGVNFFSLALAPGYISPMHLTDSIDFGYVVSGEVTLRLENGTSTALRQGDAFVQRGTMHQWIVHGSDPCQLLVTTVAAGDGCRKSG